MHHMTDAAIKRRKLDVNDSDEKEEQQEGGSSKLLVEQPPDDEEGEGEDDEGQDDEDEEEAYYTSPAHQEAEACFAEALALMADGQAEDTRRVIQLFHDCQDKIRDASLALKDSGSSSSKDYDEYSPEEDLRRLNSLAYMFLGKIREQEDKKAEAERMYQCSQQAWYNNPTTCFALAKIYKVKGTPERLRQVEGLLGVAVAAPVEDHQIPEDREKAVQELALLLLQKRQVTEADHLLASLGMTHRLAEAVLGYRDEKELAAIAKRKDKDSKKEEEEEIDRKKYIQAFDHVLSPSALSAMQSIFARTSPFWPDHGYGDFDTGYFSYLYDLKNEPRISIEAIIKYVVLPQAIQAFPEVAEKATVTEWWAHCREHAVGHQLHFDSEDEGRGHVRHPIASTVLYLSEGIGGPTFMTDQILSKGGLATKGWFVHPRINRLVVFDARYLHGVIPGRGLPPPPYPLYSEPETRRRITFMVGFWSSIRPKSYPADGRPGASMALPPNIPTFPASLAAAMSEGPEPSSSSAMSEDQEPPSSSSFSSSSAKWLHLAKSQLNDMKQQGGAWSQALANPPSPAGCRPAQEGLDYVSQVWEPITTSTSASSSFTSTSIIDGRREAAGPAKGEGRGQATEEGKEKEGPIVSLPHYDQCFQGF